MTLTRKDRRCIMDQAHARAEARARYSLCANALKPGLLDLAQQVLDAQWARDRVRAMLISLARETGRFSSRDVLSPAEVAQAIARDDDERHALIDGLIAGAQKAEDDWIALGAALVRHRYERPEIVPGPGM